MTNKKDSLSSPANRLLIPHRTRPVASPHPHLPASLPCLIHSRAFPAPASSQIRALLVHRPSRPRRPHGTDSSRFVSTRPVTQWKRSDTASTKPNVKPSSFRLATPPFQPRANPATGKRGWRLRRASSIGPTSTRCSCSYDAAFESKRGGDGNIAPGRSENKYRSRIR
jgi:hypothetical protein